MVKRYKLVDGLLRFSDVEPMFSQETYDLFTGEKHVVLASDYAALAAELAHDREQWNLAVKDSAEQQKRIGEIEAALHEIADFSEQFIGDADDASMYKVNQIADTALALDRRDEP